MAWTLISASRNITNIRLADMIELEDPSPLTRHLILVYCRHSDNYSSSCSTSAPFETCFIAKHRHCCLWCTANCTQYQLAVFRPSQWDSINTYTIAWLFACIPDKNQSIITDNATQITTVILLVINKWATRYASHRWVEKMRSRVPSFLVIRRYQQL